MKRHIRAFGASRRARLEISLLLGLCLTIFLSVRFAGFARLADTVRQHTLRLHVRACSNTPEDQLHKLRVRDAVLAAAGEIFSGAPDKTAAMALARTALPRLQLTAEQAFAAAGGAPGTPVQVTLTRSWFASARYGESSLPPGRYDALRVELGRHTGRNWFCVLYPALCLPAAEEAGYPTEEEQALVQNGYELRFAALEWFDRLTGQDREPGQSPDAAADGTLWESACAAESDAPQANSTQREAQPRLAAAVELQRIPCPPAAAQPAQESLGQGRGKL